MATRLTEHAEIGPQLALMARHKYLILTFCISATLTSLALTYVFSEKYMSFTTILYRPEDPVTFRPKLREALGFPMPMVPLESIGNTLGVVAKSDTLLERVVLDLNLHDRPKKPASNWIMGAFQDVKGSVKALGGDALQILKHGRLIPKDPLRQAVVDLRKNLSIKQTTKAYSFRLEVLDSDPRLAAAIVDAVGKALGDTLSENNMRAAQEERARLETRLTENERELSGIREGLQQFKDQERISSLGEELSLNLKSVAQFQQELAEAEIDLRGVEKRRAELISQLQQQEQQVKYLSTTTENPVVDQLKREIASMEIERSGLLEKFTEKHQSVKEVDARLDQARERLNRETEKVVSSESVRVSDIYQKVLSEKLGLDAELHELRAKSDSLRAAIQDSTGNSEQLTRRESRMRELNLQLAAAERSHELISEAYEEARIAETKAASEVAVLHKAAISSAPVRPIKVLHVAVAALLSLALAIGFVFLSNFFDTTLRRVDQTERVLSLPVFASIPFMEHGDDTGQSRVLRFKE